MNKYIEIKMSATTLEENKKTVSYMVAPNYGQTYNESNENVYVLNHTTKGRYAKNIPCSTRDHRHLNWSVTVNQNHLLDSYAKIVFPDIKFIVRGDFTAVNPTETNEFLRAEYFQDVCLKPGGLLNCSPGVSVSVNGVDLKANRSEMRPIMHTLLAHASVDDTLSSGVASAVLDRYQFYDQHAAGASAMKVIMEDGATPGYIPRIPGGLSPFIETAGTSSYAVDARRFNVKNIEFADDHMSMSFRIENLEVPLLMSIFSMNNLKDRLCIPGVDKLEIGLQINQAISHMFGLRDGTFSNAITSFDDIELIKEPILKLIEVSTPDYDMEYIQKFGYPRPFSMTFPNMITLYQKKITSSDFSSAIVFDTMDIRNLPRYLYITMLKTKTRGRNDESDINYATTSRSSVRCNSAVIRYNLTQNTYDEQQLIDTSLRNGIKNWSRDELTYTVGNLVCLKLDLSKDIASGADNLFINQRVKDTFSISLNCTELDINDQIIAGENEYQLYVFGEYDKIYEYEKGTVTIGEFIVGDNAPVIGENNIIKPEYLIRSRDAVVFGGASLWSKIKGVGSSVIRNLPGIAKIVMDGVNLYRTARGGKSESTIIGGKSSKGGKKIGGASLDSLHGF